MGSVSKTFALLILGLVLSSSVDLQPVAVKAEPQTLVVPDDFPTIQAAINNASAGDTVYVKAGNYTTVEEPCGLYACNLFINKSMSLIGESSKDTVITTAKKYYYSCGIYITADNVTVSGFTMVGGSEVVWIDNGSATVSNNIINMTNDSDAIYAAGSGYALISSNTINALEQDKGTGIDNANDGQTIISNNLISDFAVGISTSNNNLSIVNNTITNNAVGIWALTSPKLVYDNNIVNCTKVSLDPGFNNVNATYNWWGTTDSQAIYQSINHYSPYNVTFTPFLTIPNPEATPIQSATIPLPTPNKPSSEIPSAIIGSVSVAVAAVVVGGLIIFIKKHKH